MSKSGYGTSSGALDAVDTADEAHSADSVGVAGAANAIGAAIEQAAQRLLEGRLVAFPTETVYGLGADAENPDAVAAIYAAKGRPANHPVIVHICPEGDIRYWASSVPDEAMALMKAFWPGPLTLIFPRASHIPAMVSGGQDSVGLRCPSHPVAQDLLRAFAALKPNGQGGVAGPSANKFGQVSPTCASHVRSEFASLSNSELLILEGGASEIGIESTIVDVSRIEQGIGPALLRPGHINVEQIEAVLGSPMQRPGQSAPRVSGSLKAHYAPRTPLTLLDRDDLLRRLEQLVREQTASLGRQTISGQAPAITQRQVEKPTMDHSRRLAVVVFDTFPRPDGVPGVDWYRAYPDPDAYAQDLYALLRRLDQGEYSQILMQRPPRNPAWQAVNDRIGRAAAAFA